MKPTPNVTKDIGTALDIILSFLGLPIEFKNVSTGVALLQQALSRDSSPDSELKELSEKIAKAIGTVLENEVSEDERQAVLIAVKSSLEKFKQNAERDGQDIKNIFADNVNSPEKLIKQICEKDNGLDGEAENCYKSIIRMTVTALCKAENVELFINQNHALVKLMQGDDKIKKLLEDNSSKIDDIKAMLVGLIKERCLTQSKLPTCSTINIFSYLNKNIKFQGRVAEQKRIEEFMLAENPFSFWSVTGKGGTGKSKFALHIAEEYIKRGWVVIWCESKTGYDDIFKKEFLNPTLFIFDYAGSSTNEIQKVLYLSSEKSEKQKIRLLFVERDKYDGSGIENWYSKIFNTPECLKYKDYAYYNESLNLGPIDDNSIKALLDNFAEERAKNTLSDNEKQKIIDYVRKTLPKKDENLDFADRCLFILFTADACLRGKNYSDWDAETLLSSYVTQYISKLSKLSKVAKLKSHLNLLAIATATGGIDIENNSDIPVLSTYIEKFINDFDYEDDVSEGQEFIRCLCEKEESNSVVTPMYPDLVGEYFFISRINNIPESVAKDWVSIFLNEKYKEYFIDFLARILEDWDLQGKLNDIKDWFLEGLQSNPDDKQYSAYLFSTLASIYQSKGNYITAVEYYEKSKDIYEKTLPENHPDLAMSYNNLGIAYDNKGDFDTAIEYYNKALKIYKKVLPENHPDLAMSYNNLGNAYDDKGDFDTAIEYHNKALKIRNEVLPENHPDLASTYNNLGVAYRHKGDFDTAIECCNKALEIRKEVLPENHPNLAMSYNNLGNAYADNGNYDTAIEYYNKALKIYKEVLPENHPDLAMSYNNLGSAYDDKGDIDTAIEHYNKALEIRKEVLPENHPDLAMSYNNLGVAYDDKGSYDTAIECYNKALKIYKKVLPENHPDLASTYNNLGVAYDDNGDFDTAIELYQKALAIYKIALPNTHPHTMGTYKNIIKAFLKKGDEENAQKYYEEMINFCK